MNRLRFDRNARAAAWIPWLLALVTLAAWTAAAAADEFAGADRCLVCHNNLPAVTTVHDEAFAGEGRALLPGGDPANRCEACHGPSAAHARPQPGLAWPAPAVVFGGAGDTSPANTPCSTCHAKAMETLDAHARSFHAIAERKELGCNRCHGGVAHGLPAWVIELREQQREGDTP